MSRIFLIVLSLLLTITVIPVQAQGDALDLPAALYILTSEGFVQRYGRGTEGISTVTPEGEFVVDFGAAPDDNWMAYRTESALMLVDRAGGEPVLVESDLADVPPVRGKGDTIAWSPLGDAIAVTTQAGARVYFGTGEGESPGEWTFTAVDLNEGQFGAFVQVMWSPDGRYMAAGTEDHIWWIYRRENQNMLLTSAITSSMGLAWVNISEIVFAPAEGGLILMNLDQSNLQTTLLDATWNYSLPYLLPDGVLAVFGRQKTDAEMEEGTGRLIGLKAQVAEILTLGQAAVNLSDLRWAPGGGLMTSFQSGVFSVVNPVTGEGFALPISAAVAYSWGALPPPEG
jgi:hypothetical protein